VIASARRDDLDSAHRRYKRVRRLAASLLARILWWDVILNRPLLRWLRPAPGPRWRRMAEEYRAAALDLGGVLVKIGQNVSARADLFPGEVIDVLSSLQDNVAPAPFDLVADQLAADFQQPLAATFPMFDPTPIGSASLGQAHRASLGNGERVVVKVMRPGIADLVRMDLDVLARFVRRLRAFPRVRKHVDLALLMDEFTALTLRELDLKTEGLSAEQFARDFADDAAIGVPRVHWDFTRAHTLTMEDVGYFPVAAVAAYEATGIDRRAVARKLTEAYLHQIFITGFVHADPHPGNLFVRPIPEPGDPVATDGTPALRPGDPIPFASGRRFQLVFVDFGMFGTVPPRARSAMRTYAIGIGTRDPRAIIQAYVEGDMLLPGADIEQLELLTAAMMDRFPRAFLGQMGDMSRYVEVFNQYQALLYNSPFKLRTDMLLVFRAMGTCAGTIALIDPDFDPSECFAPLAQRMIMADWNPNLEKLRWFVTTLFAVPGRLDRLLSKLEYGELSVKTESRNQPVRELRALAGAARSVAFAVAGAAIVAGLSFLGHDIDVVTTGTGLALVGVAALFGLLLGRR
jgi:predicted unusual protein kinase regulating ubiquinone biosynthesis (AarF/ABC1/UbiB family)